MLLALLALAESGAVSPSTGRSSPPCWPSTWRCSRFALFAVADVWRGGAVGLAVLVALTAAPHVAAGWVTVRGYSVLENVFADEEPDDVMRDRGLLFTELPPLPRYVAPDTWELALVERLGPGEVAPLERSARVLADAKPKDAKPWTTILLLGTDEGPGNFGARTDTIILAADPARHRTRRRVRDPAQPRPGAARTEAEALEGAAQRPLRAERRRRRRARARSSRPSRTCSGSASTTTRSSTCSASPISSTRSAASRSRSRSGSSTR